MQLLRRRLQNPVPASSRFRHASVLPDQKSDAPAQGEDIHIRSARNHSERSSPSGPTLEDMVRAFAEVAALTSQPPTGKKAFEVSTATTLENGAEYHHKADGGHLGNGTIHKDSSKREVLADNPSFGYFALLSYLWVASLNFWNPIRRWTIAALLGEQRRARLVSS